MLHGGQVVSSCPLRPVLHSPFVPNQVALRSWIVSSHFVEEFPLSSTTTLVSHCGAREVNRDELDAIEAPPSTKTWFPVRHSAVVESVSDLLQSGGFQIRQATYRFSKRRSHVRDARSDDDARQRHRARRRSEEFYRHDLCRVGNYVEMTGYSRQIVGVFAERPCI